MNTPRNAALLGSGGKDSSLALYHARKSHPDIEIVKLITCLSEEYDRVSMHGVRRELVADQADALGLPVEFVVIPNDEHDSCPIAHSRPGTAFPPNDVYTREILASFARLKAEGVGVIVFGDIFLEDLRAFRDQLLLHVGLEGRYPLWGRDTSELYAEFLALRFAAVTVCVDTNRLAAEVCGRLLDARFRESLPEGADACGERGEYHSFTFDGPPFLRPVPFKPGEFHRQDPFVFQEIYPGVLAAQPAV